MVFRVCLGYTLVSTAIWFTLLLSGKDGGRWFGDTQVSWSKLGQLAFSILLFFGIYSYAFYGLKYWLLKRAGLSQPDLKSVFGNRLRDFELEALLSRHSERTLRIIDMIGRRGRMLVLVVASFGFVYARIRDNPSPDSLLIGLQSSLLDAVVMSWWMVLTFHSNGPLGHMCYGAHARVLDGILGRANVLCIGTLWNAFKFVMIPIGSQLTTVYPPRTYAVLYAFIWLSYATADFAAEIFGSIWGKHSIRVWGLGDLNRKSWVGVGAAFVCTLSLNWILVAANGLSISWWVLGALIALLNPIVELVSPRGTDDFTMATSNALFCLGFGTLFDMRT
jgi:hypothetical protein